MYCYITECFDSGFGAVYPKKSIATNIHDVTQVHVLLRGKEEAILDDFGHRGV